MTEAEKKALAIYEMICATSGGRPLSGTSVEQLLRETADWKARNPALAELSRSEPQVRLAFLTQSFEWLRAEALVNGNLRVCQTMWEAIQLALTEAPKPLPAELVRHLLSEYRKDLASMTHIYFPFAQLLSLLTRDQVTDEVRFELRKLHLHFAPSPTGKIDEQTQQTRDRIAELMWVEGEQELDPGRGPWSQCVFEEIGAEDEITRSGWEGLLEHCRGLEQTVPGPKWKKRSRELVGVIPFGEGGNFSRWCAKTHPNQTISFRDVIRSGACARRRRLRGMRRDAHASPGGIVIPSVVRTNQATILNSAAGKPRAAMETKIFPRAKSLVAPPDHKVLS